MTTKHTPGPWTTHTVTFAPRPDTEHRGNLRIVRYHHGAVVSIYRGHDHLGLISYINGSYEVQPNSPIRGRVFETESHATSWLTGEG
jgi:hypothetical protein